jgi:lysozyme family protein
MDTNRFSKREMLRLGVGAAAGALAGSRAFAQDSSLFGLPVPKEILDILPRKPLNYVRMADAVVRLEREADKMGLPQSPLALGKGQSLAQLADSLYEFAMPRLVALIDRSETVDIGFADKAGELLAELHQSQHELPEALRLSLPAPAQSLRPTKVRYLDQPEEPQPEIIFVPGTPDAPLPPSPAQPDTPPAKVEAPPVDDNLPLGPLSRARDYASLKSEYGKMYRRLEVRPQYADKAGWHVEMMRNSRKRYENVGEQTGVPWYFIAATHALEASFNFRAHLHNGDFPLSSRTRQVPAGRPTKWLPPSDWESSAKDALRLLGFTGQQDWSLERTLYRLEAYNGLGYRGLGVPTPYLWCFSNHYERGKYVADSKYSATAKSQQCGAAVMLKLLEKAGEITLEPAT